MVPAQTSWRQLVIAAGLAGAVAWVYSGVGGHDFIPFDDDVYITQNPVVTRGLTAEGFAYAFTTTDAANWHPLTWLSHMLDVELFGLDAGAHHWVNVALHMVNALLVGFFFTRATGQAGRAWLVAALFALHPLRVESVAWAAERKDVLSVCFGLLAMHAYLGAARAAGARALAAHGLVALLYAMSLLAKPTLVTLPFLLVLLDFWPLGRGGSWRRVAEKSALFLLAAASCLTTLHAQEAGGALRSLEQLGFAARTANAAAAYLFYVWKSVWPARLALLYPHPGEALPLWRAGAALALLVLMSAWLFRLRRQRPELLVCWLWFLGTLVPVLGLVQVGAQAVADRYSYFPAVGLSALVVFAPRPGRGGLPAALVPAALLLVVALAVAGKRQVSTWQDGETLFRRTLQVTADNHVIHNNYGLLLSQRGRMDEALFHLERALAIEPDYLRALRNAGAVLMRLGRRDEAILRFERAARNAPEDVESFVHLGSALVEAGRLAEGEEHLRTALARAPEHVPALLSLGMARLLGGRPDQARSDFARVIELDPRNVPARLALARLDERAGSRADAIKRYREVLRLDPGHAEARRQIDRLEADR